jgi:HSP20 family protein
VRSFSLAKSIDIDRVKAEFNDGILKVELPKKEGETSKTKNVEIT